jgi:hypothetical protein
VEFYEIVRVWIGVVSVTPLYQGANTTRPTGLYTGAMLMEEVFAFILRFNSFDSFVTRCGITYE